MRRGPWYHEPRVPPTIGIPLPLRNALAALTLRALTDAPARATLEWLLTAGAAPADDVARTLVAVGLADPPGRRLLDLYDAFVPHVRAHAARAFVAARAHATAPAPTDARDAALIGAACLWAHGLFFEVHEIVEPEWARASGDVREALQGLIQVAVAFHHLAHGNPRGARKLLIDGREKLTASGHALPRIDSSALLADTEPWVEAFAARTPVPEGPVPPIRLR